MSPRNTQLLILGSSVVMAGILTVVTVHMRNRPKQDQPESAVTEVRVEEDPVRVQLPPFELTERSGKPYGSKQLQGKVWIGDFIFTSCPSICPLLTEALADLQQELRKHPRWDDLRLVSISVDPETDTPQVLRTFADRYQADPERWVFLTGKRSDIWELINGGFKLPVGEPSRSTSGHPIYHSQRFVLVDRHGRIRGYYEGLGATAKRDRARLLKDLDRILAER